MVFLFFSLLFAGAGLGIQILLSQVHIPYVSHLYQINRQSGYGSQKFMAGTVSEEVRLVKENEQSGVGNLAVFHSGENTTGIEFTLSPADSCKFIYVWLVINPDALPGDETAIYPRNPMYRGIPVDYRNGLEFGPAADKKVSIEISDLISDAEFKTFTILAYSPDGTVLVNSTYQVTQGPGVS